MKAVKVLFALILLFFVFKTHSEAVSISISGVPSSVTDQPFPLTASVSGQISGTHYLKVEIYKEGTNNYFGETYNGSSWYSGGDGKLYYPVTMDSLSKTGIATFQSRIGTPNNTDYPGSGTYKLRIRRYTSTAQSSSIDDQTPAEVTINYTAPTFTPTPTVTPTPTPTTAPTPSVKPTSTPTASPTITNVNSQATSTNSNQQVLGQTQTSQNDLFEIPEEAKDKDKDDIKTFSSSDQQIISKIFIFFGVVFMILCAIVIFYPKIDAIIKQRIHE